MSPAEAPNSARIVRAMTGPLLTDRTVTLRPWAESDADTIVACVDGDAEIAVWLDQVPQPYTADDARAFIDGTAVDQETYAVTDTDSGRVLGSIGLSRPADGVCEIGYWIRADARGQGATTRALVLLSRVVLAREGVERLQLRADVENLSSCRVAEKAGFTREGVLRSAHWNARLGRRQDWAMYSLLPADVA
jgi:RimJ/RimL family protein N-acetyltransferase